MARECIVKRTPLRRVSDKKRVKDAEYAAARKQVEFRSRGFCEATTPACLTGRHEAHHVHHVKRRSQGGGHDVDNLLHLCFPAHEWVHAHPAEARERGWLA